MTSLKLVVGNKLHASWSLRAWFLMRAFALDFEEQVVSIYQPDSKPKLLEHSPSGRVPVLIHGGVTVWDSLAITEYLAEAYPDLGIWPQDNSARAHARAIAAEMHAEFRALRAACPMNLGKRFAPKDRGEAVRRDVTRIMDLLKMTRAQFGGQGAYLFSRLTAADAFYLPVLTRFDTYGIAVDPELQPYMRLMLEHDAYKAWRGEALSETWIIPKVEVDETPIEMLRQFGPMSRSEG